MRALLLPFLFTVTFFNLPKGYAQTALQAEVKAIAADARGTVSVSCLLPGTALNCDLNAHNHPPMQSMFKYPLALTVLHLAETGKLFPHSEGEPIDSLLDRKVRFLQQDRIAHTFSPLQDRFPEANVDVTLREVIESGRLGLFGAARDEEGGREREPAEERKVSS